jgi:hypothetical protein
MEKDNETHRSGFEAHQSEREGIVTRKAWPFGETQRTGQGFPANMTIHPHPNGPRRSAYFADTGGASQNPVSAMNVTFISPVDNANAKGFSIDGFLDTCLMIPVRSASFRSEYQKRNAGATTDVSLLLATD